ncbi:hypothetical protein PsorP6_010680 [Peronosclerospora sorghi]|uniref:Uncharacterized protein n=1 Tax=Peronosclerospora sorghi TaxID=230839 RepID=A0ACC0VWI0_9STRA|nr:hypothetical protein PsorP6_010680 [Peronosclerospora sorghi]
MDRRKLPFPILSLTPEQEQLCRDRSFQLLDRTLRSYDERDGNDDTGRLTTPRHHSKLESTRWKQLKSKKHASLYIERKNSIHRDDNILGGDWKNPMIFITVGTIEGGLEEVMLGVETPIVQNLRERERKKELIYMQPAAFAVLAELAGPTEANPFQYMGIQWLAMEYTWPLKAVSLSRDFVILASIGTMKRANGDMIGYLVVQPAKLAQFPPVPNSERSNVIHAAIFKQKEPGLVDVFVQTYFEPRSPLLDKAVVHGIWKTVTRLWTAPHLAQMKKMQWCLANCKAQAQYLQHQTSFIRRGACTKCYERMKWQGNHPKDLFSCVLCGSLTCLKCRVEQILEIVEERKCTITAQRVTVCQACILFVQRMRPEDIVRQWGER